jgi:AcrR family transcriptional regulator
MGSHLNGVKMKSGERAYHHGALRAALIAAAEAVIAERGVDGFSLREAARRAGVSPAAPGHHFRDARGLLTAVATAAFEAFGDALQAADADAGPDRTARIRGQGRAYVAFALANPARFDLMWRRTLLDGSDAALAAAGRRAFAILDRAVRGNQPEPGGPADPALAPSIAAWSLVHGFARLALEGGFGAEPGAAEKAAEALLPRVLEGLAV